MAKPIILFGLNRNGTTGLSNIIHERFSVAMAFHELNFGSCEINLYRIAKKYGSFKSQEKYLKFLEAYKNSDVFIALEGNLTELQNQKFDHFYAFFISLINCFATKHNKAFYSFKLEPQILLDQVELTKLLEAYSSVNQEIHFISIKRNLNGYLNSVIALYKKNKTYSKQVDLLYLAEYHHYYEAIDKFIKLNNGIDLTFDDLKDSKSLEKQLSSFLNIIPIISKIGTQAIIRNSSTGKSKKEALSFIQSILSLIFKHFKFTSSMLINYVEKKRFQNSAKAKYWNERIKLANENPQLLIDSFEEKYESILIPLIREKYLNK